MGGNGSGEYGHRGYTLDDCLRLDIRRIVRNGWSGTLRWLNAEGECRASANLSLGLEVAALDYSVDGERRRYAIALSRTRCNYGGERVWFRCPARACGRRSAVLYARSGWFVCRKCAGRKYESQSESQADRMLRKRDKILRSIGIDPYGDGEWSKPPRMHLRRYEKLIEAAVAAETASLTW